MLGRRRADTTGTPSLTTFLEIVVAELEPLAEPLGRRHLVGRLTLAFV
jgi:hypothetical protein